MGIDASGPEPFQVALGGGGEEAGSRTTGGRVDREEIPKVAAGPSWALRAFSGFLIHRTPRCVACLGLARLDLACVAPRWVGHSQRDMAHYLTHITCLVNKVTLLARLVIFFRVCMIGVWEYIPCADQHT